jgi:NTP pyrophosphatase (non-canonical NTP hydrolase)
VSPASIQHRFKEHVEYRNHNKGQPMPWHYMVLGLVGEVAEAPGTQELIDETGDALWYAEALCSFFGTTLSKVVTHRDGRPLIHHLGKISELAKKDAWHGKPADRGKVLYHLGAVVSHLDRIAERSGFTLEEAMEANIIKLEKRYPRGFVQGGGIREKPVAQLAPAVGTMLEVRS